jgi:hypothetical protein
VKTNDFYLEGLTEAIFKIESAFGLASSEDPSDVGDVPIKSLMLQVSEEVASVSEAIMGECMYKAFPGISAILHLTSMLDFYEECKLTFSTFPYADKVKESLVFVSNVASLRSPEYVAHAKLLVSVLDIVDRKHLTLRYTLTYRLIRLIVFFVSCKLCVEAGILSKALLSQSKLG